MSIKRRLLNIFFKKRGDRINSLKQCKAFLRTRHIHKLSSPFRGIQMFSFKCEPRNSVCRNFYTSAIRRAGSGHKRFAIANPAVLRNVDKKLQTNFTKPWSTSKVGCSWREIFQGYRYSIPTASALSIVEYSAFCLLNDYIIRKEELLKFVGMNL